MQVTPVNCIVANSGAIDLTVSEPCSYQWSNNTNTEDLTGITTGLYRVTITSNASGCTNLASSQVSGNSSMVLTVTTPPVNCAGATSSSIDLSVTGGTPAYTYQWSNGSTTQDLNNAGNGTYTVTVTDAVGCSKTTSITVTIPTAINVFPTIVSSSCNNSDGAINLSISGGVPPYQTVWSNGSTEEDLVNVSAGIYTVTVTDLNGCSAVRTRSVSDFALTIGYTPFNCLTNLSANASGGAPEYTYAWSNGETTQSLTGLTSGTFTVTVTDAQGCRAMAQQTVTALTPVSAYINIYGTAPCAGGLTGHIINGGPSGTDYLWSTGATSQFLSNIPAGTYTVTVTASSSCTASASITISQPMTNSGLGIQGGATPIVCNGGTSSINLSVNGNVPPFSYAWSNGSNLEDQNNLPAGTYTVTVTDANGCTQSRTFNITEPPPMVASWVVNDASCFGANGSISLNINGGTPFPNFSYTYQWSTGATTKNLQNLPAGTYRVTVTDANSCTYTSPDIIVASPFFTVSINPLSIQCNSAVLEANIQGGSPPYSIGWWTPGGPTIEPIPVVTIGQSGLYLVAVVDANGCEAEAALEVTLGNDGNCGYLSGRILYDQVENCLEDATEPGLPGWLVRAENATDTIYGVTNATGYYTINAPAGTYTIQALPPNGLWEVCTPAPSVTVDSPADTAQVAVIPVKALYQCPSLSVNIGVNRLRACFNNNNYQLQYCNQGTVAAEDAYVLITLDPLITPVSSSVPFTNLGNGVLRFDIGHVDVSECGGFSLKVLVSCNADLGQTLCTEAHIYPDANCIPSDPEWSGASLRISSQCTQDSVRFKIDNIGTGDMLESADYIVVEDAVMLLTAPFQLGMGMSTQLAVPANGSTWRMEVPQVPFHPGLSMPSISVEGCSAIPVYSTGYVSQFPTDDADPWIDIDCTETTAAVDPNDKQGFPLGYGPEHYIRPGTELEYMIRFQNTGTDTAFTVRIVDTLSSWLDPATIRPGVSSHPYQFSLTGPGIVEFLYENILLPDSNINQAASNGFVKFSIYPKADAPLETLIENTAHIYFDFNEAVVTNTTRHRLGENFLTVGAWNPQRPQYQVLVSPNPMTETVRLEVKGLESNAPVHLQVMNLQGTVVADQTASGPVLILQKAGLPAGMYLFKLDQKGRLIGSGKLIVKSE